MPLAVLLQLVQILSGAGAAATDFIKIADAVKARGGSHLTDSETATVHAQLRAAHGSFDDESVNGG